MATALPLDPSTKSITDISSPMEDYNQMCSFCLRPATEVSPEVDHTKSGYRYSKTLGAHRRSLGEIERGAFRGKVDDLLELGMRYDVELVVDHRILTWIKTQNSCRPEWT
jgi:hypothetical protein